MGNESLKRPSEDYCRELEARLNNDPIFIAELLADQILFRRSSTDPQQIAEYDIAIASLRKDFNSFGIPLDYLI